MPDLAGAAVAYAEAGWPVFPVEPKGKRPLGRLVPHGLKQATSDVDVVREWWRRAPNANIGLATGVAFDVLDIDTDEAMASLDQSCAAAGEAGDFSIDGPTCRTGGGGVHCYVQRTEGGNKAGLLGHKLDWRGLGGYVVAPPSVHASGRLYEWVDGWSPADVAPGPMPAWALELLGVGPKPAPPAPRASSSEVRNPESGAYGRRALEAEVFKVLQAPQGKRNHTLNEAAFAVGQLIAGGEITDHGGAYDALQGAGLGAGLTGEEVAATIRSGLDSGSRQPRSAPKRTG